MGTRLFIGNLSYSVNEQELKEAFTSEGIEVRSDRLSLDRETGRPRGFAFVETETDAGAKASIEKLSGRVLQGRPIIVEEALALKPRPAVIWMQLGIRNDDSAALAEIAGVKVVMNRCPKIEYGRLSSEIGWIGVNSRTLTSKRAKILGKGVQRMSRMLDRVGPALLFHP